MDRIWRVHIKRQPLLTFTLAICSTCWLYIHEHCISQHKKASNHHANLPLEMYSFTCNHLGNTWKPLVLMTRHFDYCSSASEGDKESVRSSAPVVSRCFPGGYNVNLYISRGRLAWWLLAFQHSGSVIWQCAWHATMCLTCNNIYLTLMKAFMTTRAVLHIVVSPYTSLG